MPDPENYSTYFLKIDGVKFRDKVVPGDTLQFELTLAEPIRRGIVLMEAKAFGRQPFRYRGLADGADRQEQGRLVGNGIFQTE